MQISLEQACKRFNKEWIFKNLSFQFEAGKHYALVGNNGSGKTTLLQIIAGYSSLTKGSIDWSPFDEGTIYEQISFAAPYLELVEEFTATEQFEFQAQFKPLQKELSTEKILALIGLKNAAHKQIRYYSSGMKQRLKLALAIFSDCPILLLDEPCSNLDKEGYGLYDTLMKDFAMHKLIIVGSNDPTEYHFCKAQVNLMDYKLD
ncbi:MAG: ABC transporter ATP-binding protein [Sediminibacterium sp.]|nr:MAG: ABC transporter ATP-binding protein [Sediminibacterium sp.]